MSTSLSQPSPLSTVLVTVSGPDAPGITSELTRILAEGKAELLDIGQAVIHGLLSLSLLFQIDEEASKNKTLIKDLLFKATELGMKLDFKVIPETKPGDAAFGAESGGEGSNPAIRNVYRYALTLIAEKISPLALHHVTSILARDKVNIDVIQRLSHSDFGCVEFIVSSTQALDHRKLKLDLLKIAHGSGVDIALQREGLYRRSKRMVVLDMDSTLIQNEVIDEMARECGKYDEVAEITHRAMKGGMDYDESLKLRVAMLKGLTLAQVENVIARIQLTPGARELIRVLKHLGYKTAVISGGFSCVADRFKAELNIDYAYANLLQFDNGVATGKVIPPIVNAQRKADLLELIAQQEKIHTDQVIAIGDGANDLLMLEKAGLGIAFNAKPLVRERASLAINQKSLSSILYLLGISGRDLQEALKNLR